MIESLAPSQGFERLKVGRARLVDVDFAVVVVEPARRSPPIDKGD
jgi:hypothetical protein